MEGQINWGCGIDLAKSTCHNNQYWCQAYAYILDLHWFQLLKLVGFLQSHMQVWIFLSASETHFSLSYCNIESSAICQWWEEELGLFASMGL